MLIIHARIVLTGNLVHVRIHRQNRVSLVCLYLTSSLNQRWLSFLDIDMSFHLINGITSLENNVIDLTHSVSLALDRLVCCYCFLHDLYKVTATMRLCNSRLPEEHFVCYQTSQRKWVIIKVLYRCLQGTCWVRIFRD